MKSPFLTAAIVFLAAMFVAGPVGASSCGEFASGDEPNAVAFVGVVTRIRAAVLIGERTLYTPVDFRVERSVHGDLPSSVRILADGDFSKGNRFQYPVSPRFERGDRYHVVAFRGSDGTYTTGPCTETHGITIPPSAQPYLYVGMTLVIIAVCLGFARWLRSW